MSETSEAGLEGVLRDRFGLVSFRPGQKEVILSVMAGKDVLCVMPTGGGKSLCYQLPAVVKRGLTLVVSPLIALMKDQVDGLEQKGIRATLINSTLEPEEQRARIIEAEAGRYDLVYVAPERFRSPRFVEAMGRANLALLAIDEAHCISQWGHDFRPDYARLGQARKLLGRPPCIALTATATDLVRRDIADQLDLDDPAQFVTGFDRPNLHYEVVTARRDQEKYRNLGRVLEQNPGSAVVYASSRKKCEEVAEFVRSDLRKSVVVYHAGLERQTRHEAQEEFMGSRAEVVVATNAFGMGVDKPDIRSVVHFNMPGTLEAYYQEAGRAGRDGGNSACVLLYSPGDIKLQQMFIENEYPPRDMVFRVYDFLRKQDADPIQLTRAEIREACGIEQAEGAVGSALRILESAGGIERYDPRENMALVKFGEEGKFSDRISGQAHVQKLVMIGLEGLAAGRVGEPVYFQPDEFAAALGLDRPALGRALKQLMADYPVVYVPPFKGQAIRVVDRDRPARNLQVDFKPLEARKRQEYEKLERMIRYAESDRCRRAMLLGYFGEEHAEKCGGCDRCGYRKGSAGEVAVDTPGAREVLLKILSGVARTKGKFGKTVIVQMLTGSESEKVRNSWLAGLSTYGILKNGGFAQGEVGDLLDALMAAGMVRSRQVGDFKPVMELSAAGWEWLKAGGNGPLSLNLSGDLGRRLRLGGLQPLARTAGVVEEAGEPEGPVVAASAGDMDLEARLRNLRVELARKGGLSPAYVFSNETMEQLIRERPATPQDLGRIKGIGPAKLERYGKALLEAIAGGEVAAAGTRTAAPAVEPKATAENRSNGRAGDAGGEASRRPGDRGRLGGWVEEAEGDEEEIATPAQQVEKPATVVETRGEGGGRSTDGAYVPTEEWTVRLLERGFSLEDVAAIRGLDLQAVARHALWMARKGRKVETAWVVAEGLRERWREHLASRGPSGPPGGDEGLGFLWTLFVACEG